jgi:acyl-lipid omega-6 desaturase (Delta-12 desaturase)
MSQHSNPDHTVSGTKLTGWRALVAEYQESSSWKAWWQIVNTLVPYALVWYLMYLALNVSWWLTVPLIPVAGGLLVRTFIIFHDCCHGSFFRHSRFVGARRANRICGFVCGLLAFTPYDQWRRDHIRHHATAGNLDQRGTGDVWTLTVQEYLQASRWKRFAYRLARNPLVLFAIAPLYMFLIHYRYPGPGSTRQERHSVWWTNLAIVVMVVGMSSVFGLIPYLMIQLGIMTVAGAAGFWLFYVQHQFEGVSWERNAQRDHVSAALQGSSFYKLPKVLQWISGNIGFHHIHHLSPQIPNYNLERCHNANPVFHDVKPVTLLSSLKSLSFRLWDESQRELVGWRRMRQLRRRHPTTKA